jgi:aspartate carbamoyltransferase catalytic subunit
MSLAGRDLVSINGFSDTEIRAVFDLADEMGRRLERRTASGPCRDRIMATLFFEPSTRTRLSFESAMLRLGGQVISMPDARSSSVAKGETIADTVRVIQHYADLIVIRNPLDGAARVAAEYSDVPVINAGDGAHEHPTQTLCDLYTICKEKGSIEGMNIALCGDLRYGRTVHSLAYALARFGARITCVAPPGLEMPDHVRNRLHRDYACIPAEFTSLDQVVTDREVIYHLQVPAAQAADAAGSNQLMPVWDLMSLFDVIYLTRVQRERFRTHAEYEAAAGSYAIKKAMLDKAKKDALIMHPLPRVDELDYRIDRDRRAAYFRQAGNGVTIRMALVALLLGAERPPAGTRPRRRAPPRCAPRQTSSAPTSAALPGTRPIWPRAL